MARMSIRRRWQLEHVMEMAHRIRRDAAKRLGCRPGEILFSECLRMAWEISLTGHNGATCDNRDVSVRGYSTKASAWRAARRQIGRWWCVCSDSHASITYADLGCTGNGAENEWVTPEFFVREDMLSVFHAENGWHYAIEWWLEDLVFSILTEDGTDNITLREFVSWTGPRTDTGWPCLNLRYAA